VTVCIAAICDGGQKVVVAADRMFTFQAPQNLEFQTPEKKIEGIGVSCVVLSSGNSAYATEVARAAIQLLDGNHDPPILHAADVLRAAFAQVRAVKIREQVLVPMLGPDYIKFEAMGVPLPQYLQYQPAIFQQIAAQMQVFNLGADMIIAGVDDSGARVAYLGNPGTLAWLDKLGYAAVGSGGIHATKLSLGSQTRDSTLSETLYRVYEAKRAAEVAPGVGPDTDVAIVERGRINMCKSDLLTKMEEILSASRGRMTPDLAELAALLPPRDGEEGT
jgi:20S proteasome alpha/beta subunit